MARPDNRVQSLARAVALLQTFTLEELSAGLGAVPTLQPGLADDVVPAPSTMKTAPPQAAKETHP